MKPAAALMLIPFAAALAGMAGNQPTPGVDNMQRASENWMLQCQGCHRIDGSGTPETAPAMRDFIARFLSVEGGREYLVQVPGTATAPLSEDQLAELLNWILYRFDPGHVPADFKPYTADEMQRLRHQPHRLETTELRRQLVAKIANSKAGNPAQPEGD